MPRRLLRVVCTRRRSRAAAARSTRARERARAQSTSVPVADLIQGYAEWVHGRRDRVELVAIDLDVVRQRTRRVDPASLPARRHARRRRPRSNSGGCLTSFALELAASGRGDTRRQRRGWSSGRARSCARMRRTTTSIAHGSSRRCRCSKAGIDSDALARTPDHLPPGLSDEPRLLLARGIAEEQFSAPAEVLTRSVAAAALARAREQLARMEGERYRAAERADRAIQAKPAKDDAIAAEASLRLGHVQLRHGPLRRRAGGVEAGSTRRTEDLALLYLMHLFRGTGLRGLRPRAAGARAYLAALEVSPARIPRRCGWRRWRS